MFRICDVTCIALLLVHRALDFLYGIKFANELML